MGIYVPNMEMPPMCHFCEFEDADFEGVDRGYIYFCRLLNHRCINRWERPSDCPLVEVKEREDGLYERIN